MYGLLIAGLALIGAILLLIASGWFSRQAVRRRSASRDRARDGS